MVMHVQPIRDVGCIHFIKCGKPAFAVQGSGAGSGIWSDLASGRAGLPDAPPAPPPKSMGSDQDNLAVLVKPATGSS